MSKQISKDNREYWNRKLDSKFSEKKEAIESIHQNVINERADKNYPIFKKRLGVQKELVELLKLQEDVIKNKRRIALCFEGRDTAGKSSTINFFSEHLRPSNFRYVHLGIPTAEEKKEWFKRWEKELPDEGKLVLFDRSWYTRALTEPTLGYCTKPQYEDLSLIHI